MDNFLFAAIYGVSNKAITLDTAIILFSAYWEVVVGVALLAYVWFERINRTELKARVTRVGLALFSAVAARFGVVAVIRYFWPRPRPFVAQHLQALINQSPFEASFPSGHATFFMAIAVYFLLSGEKKVGWFLLASAVIISLARVAAGVHYPSDIAAGWLAGVAVSWLVFKLKRLKSGS
ncbi:MAG: phosphatase PAP2 family protein [Parcubacteria group bacterium]|nr:phosphatase PAP2 family protein [Parcubacteria group bacterium]